MSFNPTYFFNPTFNPTKFYTFFFILFFQLVILNTIWASFFYFVNPYTNPRIFPLNAKYSICIHSNTEIKPKIDGSFLRWHLYGGFLRRSFTAFLTVTLFMLTAFGGFYGDYFLSSIKQLGVALMFGFIWSVCFKE